MKIGKTVKNKSLAYQIWIVFAGVIISIFIILSILFLFSIRKFFTKELYNTIEIAQKDIIIKANGHKKEYEYWEKSIQERQNIKSVFHVVYPFKLNIKVKKITSDRELEKQFWDKVVLEWENQDTMSKRYMQKLGNSKIYYVITKYDFSQYEGKEKEGFLLSYMWDTYRNKLVKELFTKIIFMTIIGILISLIVAIRFSRQLTRPLKILANNVSKIGKKDWYKSVNLKREDEIGRLSKSIEKMRKQLVKRNETQQWILQHISHELKTPVMIIRSYAKSVEDGIFPKGDLISSIEVIDEEAERLEKRIKELLYLTKLEYMSKHKYKKYPINFKECIEKVIEKFKVNKLGINWEITLDSIKILSNKEHLNVVIENILDNSMRYAQNEIKIFLKKNDKFAQLRVYNDGESIKEDNIEKIFNAFEKGKKGNFGIGLTIVKQIVNMYNGHIWVKNEDQGVAFYIEFSIVED